jgi:translation initiation factor 2 beta subunit (eIF-2beta)/eIF-5
MSVNVDGSSDPTYRYKMPRLALTVLESKGGLTQISNTEAVSKALNRTPEQLRAYFSSDLKTATRVVTAGNGGSVIQLPGKLVAATLQASLGKYIQSNVLCATCRCPETRLSGDKIACSACGAARQVKK